MDIEFDGQGKIYGLLYAKPWRDLEKPKHVEVHWFIALYHSEKSRNAHIRRYQEPGRPLFSFELDIKSLAARGTPIPFTPDERNKKHLPSKKDPYWGEFKKEKPCV